MISSSNLHVSSFKPFQCNSCLTNKSHKLPFGVSSLSSTQPLQLIYLDAWGPPPVLSVDGFCYSIVFVDYFTKYLWLFPLK